MTLKRFMELKFTISQTVLGDKLIDEVGPSVLFYSKVNGRNEDEFERTYQQLVEEMERLNAAGEDVPPAFEEARSELETGAYGDINKAP